MFHRRRFAKMAEEQLQTLYAATQRLLKDGETAKPLADFLVTFAWMAGRPSMARSFLLRRLIFRKLQRHSEDAGFDAALENLSTPQRQALATVLFSGLLASALASPLLSWFYLPQMLSAFEAPKSVDDRKPTRNDAKGATEVALAIRNGRAFAHALARPAYPER